MKFRVAPLVVTPLAAALALTAMLGTGVLQDPRPVPLEMFESGLPAGMAVSNATAEVLPNSSSAGPAPAGHHLRLTPSPTTSRPTIVRLQIKPSAALQSADSLRWRARYTGESGQGASTTRPLTLRLLALDANGGILRLRRTDLAPAPGWSEHTVPLKLFRWDQLRGGPWSETRTLAVVIENAAGPVELDDLELTPASPPTPAAQNSGSPASVLSADDYIRLAFPSRSNVARDGNTFVATDVEDAQINADLKTLLADMERARMFVRRVFAAALNPIEGEPAGLLIFANTEGRAAFFTRLGKEWNVTIQPPRLAGYTVQTLATGLWDEKQRATRPMFLHEAVHAEIARQLRLAPGSPRTGWIQEGTASYVQLCVHPTALHANYFPSEFALAAGGIEKGRFVSLARLFTEPLSDARYAQAASVVGFLLETDPDLFATLIQGIYKGQTAEAILKSKGRTVDDLQTAWLQWGRTRWPNGPRPDRTHFDLPQEWQKK